MKYHTVTLDSVCTINPRLPKETDGSQKVSFLQMASVSEKGTILSQETRVLSETNKGFTYFERGDILLAKITPCFENGKAVLTDKLEHSIGFGSTEFHVIRPLNNVAYGKYIFYLIWNNRFRQFGEHAMKGAAGQKRISSDFLKKFEIPLPPLAEQKQIAAILDAADSLRQKDQQLVEHYTALSQSLFLEMFGDPVTNTMGWDLVKLGNVCGVGSSKRVFVNEFVESGVPFYRGTEVGQLGSGQSIKPHLFISEEHYERFKKESGVPQIGDLLLPSICHDGRIWCVTTKKPFYFKDGRVLWIKVDRDAINSEYLRYFLKGLFLTNYSNYASGTTFAELKIVALKSMRILNPPINLQNQFGERIAIIEQQKQQAQTNLQKSEALFNSLLQRAFTGELTADKAA